MSLVLDAGAFVALERRDRDMWAILGLSERSGSIAKTHGGVIAQVWRSGGGRQALLARAVRSIETLPLDLRLGQQAGRLMARAGLHDAIDAALVAMCKDGDQIATSDPSDLGRLVAAAGIRIDVIPV